MEKMKEVITAERGQEMPGPQGLRCGPNQIHNQPAKSQHCAKVYAGFLFLTKPLWSAWCFPLLQKGNWESEKLLLVQNLSAET